MESFFQIQISLLALYFAPTFFFSGLALTLVSAVNPFQVHIFKLNIKSEKSLKIQWI